MNGNHTDLMAKLASVPRLTFVPEPTPLHALDNLSRQLGRKIYLKRDDLAGPAMGGNKARKLEYLMAGALADGAQKVVTFGGLQSNHARMTAAVANQCGLETHLLYFERRPQKLEGNLYLNQLLGARMHFIPLGGGGNRKLTLETTNRMVRRLARVLIGNHYFIPVGGHNALGCLGYVRAAAEIVQQARDIGLEQAWVVTACGTGGTLAGLMAGFHLLDVQFHVLGIDIGNLWKAFPSSIACLASDLCELMGRPHTFDAGSTPIVESRYVGKRYGVPSQKGNAAMSLMGRREGITLDPIYTAKAFGGMLDMIRRGAISGDGPIIFLHSGGVAGLFAFPESVS